METSSSQVRPAKTELQDAPLFSVVMPVFNRAEIVLDAVQSVLAQSFAEFEFFIVDDNSTDGTRDALDQVSDPRVTVVTNSRSKGAAGARNTGIFLSHGEWVCQIDSDDLWPDDMLQRFADTIRRVPETVGIVYGSLAYVEMETGRVMGVRRAEVAGDVHVDFLENHFICHCAAALRADILREIGGYDEAFRSKIDSDLLLRMTARCLVEPVPDALYKYRVGGSDQLSVGNRGFLRSYEQYMRKHAGLLANRPRARFRLLSNILVLSINQGDWRRAFRVWLRLTPALIKEPMVFVAAHYRAVRAASDYIKGRLLRRLRRP